MEQTEINKVLKLLQNAESQLKAARDLLEGKAQLEQINLEQANFDLSEVKSYADGEQEIVEGVFDGQAMIGPNDKRYPIPANYVSKSKLVEGDRMKLTIMPNGTFLYKQIAPTEREFVKGILVKEDGQFKAIVNDKSYKVILASVTYHKGEAGDEVTLVIPKNRESLWGAIEAVIPQVQYAPTSMAEAF